jgi:NhaP-type Na+/H+ or K+/H+ antiporter
MSEDQNSLKGPLGFIAFVVIVEVILGLLATSHLWWASVALFILMASIQAASLLLLWYVFRLLLRVSDRLKTLEEDK